MIRRFRQNPESGAAIMDYVIALVILGLVFLVTGAFLQKAGSKRAQESVKTAESMVPCGGPDSLLSGDECK